VKRLTEGWLLEVKRFRLADEVWLLLKFSFMSFEGLGLGIYFFFAIFIINIFGDLCCQLELYILILY
jgi:hypothetical protein